MKVFGEMWFELHDVQSIDMGVNPSSDHHYSMSNQEHPIELFCKISASLVLVTPQFANYHGRNTYLRIVTIFM